MKNKSKLFLNAAAFLVAILITAPNATHSEILKGITQKLTRCFGNQALTPKRFANPVAKLVFVIPFGKVVPMQANTADGLTVFF